MSVGRPPLRRAARPQPCACPLAERLPPTVGGETNGTRHLLQTQTRHPLPERPAVTVAPLAQPLHRPEPVARSDAEWAQPPHHRPHELLGRCFHASPRCIDGLAMQTDRVVLPVI